MRISIDGRFSAQVMTVMAVAAGAWQLGVRSLHGGLAEARAQGVAARNEIVAHESRFSAETGSPLDAIQAFKVRRGALYSRSAESSDAAKIYESLGKLAAARNVRIDRIEPARGPARDAHSRAGARCEAVGYSIEARGEYADLASFADAVQTELGVTKVLSIKISPAGADATTKTMLSASIETAHFKILSAAGQGGKEWAK